MDDGRVGLLVAVAWPGGLGAPIPMDAVRQVHSSAQALVTCAVEVRERRSIVLCTAYDDCDALLVCGIDPLVLLHYRGRRMLPGWSDLSSREKVAEAKKVCLGLVVFDQEEVMGSFDAT